MQFGQAKSDADVAHASRPAYQPGVMVCDMTRKSGGAAVEAPVRTDVQISSAPVRVSERVGRPALVSGGVTLSLALLAVGYLLGQRVR